MLIPPASREELVQRDRIVAHAHAGRVVDRVGDGRADAADAEFADALGLHWRGHRVGLVEEDDFLVRDVGVDRHLVAGQVVVDEEAEALVDREFLHQRGADAHRHRADDLAARRLRVQDAARGADREHAPDADLAGRGVDADFDEMRAEGRLLVPLAEVAVLDLVLSDDPASPAAWASGRLRLPERTWPSANTASAELKPSFCATASRSLTQAA